MRCRSATAFCSARIYRGTSQQPSNSIIASRQNSKHASDVTENNARWQKHSRAVAFMLDTCEVFVLLFTHHFEFAHCHFHLLLRRPAHLLSSLVHARRVITNAPLQLAISLRPESSDDVTNMIVQSFTSSSLCSLTPNNPLLCLSPAARSMLA